MAQPHEQSWIEKARAQGLSSALMLILDALEPLGPLAAQILWVMQPAAGLFGWRQTIGGIAEALEEPGGVERLRCQLAEVSDKTGTDQHRD